MRSIAGSVERIADATPGVAPKAEIESAPVQVDHHGAGNSGGAREGAKEGAHGHA
jgi:hypothetical protein